ncbi:hypothetical protein D3OALGA1CA_966 [Olavius algarvensis associated proteobacterium Delta 3]|nr:hypothetical protein D3OALGA1CA_966 [Olavius algarvensis associated proteobacterium Delta 3]
MPVSVNHPFRNSTCLLADDLSPSAVVRSAPVTFASPEKKFLSR